jgi:hypothetical protein
MKNGAKAEKHKIRNGIIIAVASTLIASLFMSTYFRSLLKSIALWVSAFLSSV